MTHILPQSPKIWKPFSMVINILNMSTWFNDDSFHNGWKIGQCAVLGGNNLYLYLMFYLFVVKYPGNPLWYVNMWFGHVFKNVHLIVQFALIKGKV